MFSPRTKLTMIKLFLGVTFATALIGSAAHGQTSTSFTATGSMASGRYNHTATLLGDGTILIAGGNSSRGIRNTAEIFDPTSGTCRSLNPNTMTSLRYGHTATLLRSGKVLIAGGNAGLYTKTAELFDPASKTFTALPSMNVAHADHTATLLQSGKVLITGGYTTGAVATKAAEVFDPASGTFTSLPPMASARLYHTATLLPSGKVLIAGGDTTGVGNPVSSAELFDPATGTFTSVSPMTLQHDFHTATTLANGKVLITGGFTGTGDEVTDAAELFDPSSGTFSLISPMTSVRYAHTATLLPNGKVLITGGAIASIVATDTAELFDPASNTFTAVAPMTTVRGYQTATLLPSGKVLIAGGFKPSQNLFTDLNTTELFAAATESFTALPPMTSVRSSQTATQLPNGKVLLAGGNDTAVGINSYAATNKTEVFDPTLRAFTAISPMTSPRNGHTATLLPSGKVLIAGGYAITNTGITPTATAELFDPTNGTFTLVSPMTVRRYGHTATLLANGKVVIAGGYGATSVTATAELFDPVTETFTSLGPMTLPRVNHTATLLSSGKILVTGGLGLLDGAATEMFDPDTKTFSAASPMTEARYGHTATLLPSGKVLILGGATGTTTPTDSAEVFDPTSGVFTSLSPRKMTVGRVYHTATVLPSGTVLIAGGVVFLGNASPATDMADLFDPSTGIFTSLSPTKMNSPRDNHTATLLPSGEVLIAGGFTSASQGTNTAELFNAGLGFSPARRPVISAVTAALVQPASLVVNGTGFRGDSEAAGGSFNSSATNYPLLQLMRIDNEESFFVPSDPATNWSDTTFSSATLGAVTPLPTGQYRVTIFTNAIPSFQKIINIRAPAGPVPLIGVVSRKAHGSAGAFDVDLPLTGNPGIECRTGGANGDYTLVFTFVNNTTVTSASVTSGTGSVSSSSLGPNPNQYTVNLTGVTNAQYVVVTLNGVLDSTGNSGNVVGPRMGVLAGDTTADTFVNSGDIAQTKSQSGLTLTNSNFREDLNADGSINSGDISLAKAHSGTALP